MRALFILGACGLAVSVMASSRAPSAPIPQGVTIHHANILVGPDGIGRPDSGVHAQAAPDSVTLYEADQNWTGTFGTQGTTDSWETELPFMGQNCITWMTFAYCANGVAGKDTVTVNLTFYDDVDGANHIQPSLIQDWCVSPGSVLRSFALTGLSPDGCTVLTITFASPVTILGSTQLGWTFTGTTSGVTNIGPVVAHGNETGLTFGHAFDWPYGSIYTFASAAAKPVVFTINGQGCQYFNWNLIGNFRLSFHGHQPWEFELKGDYGVSGPPFARPRDHVYMNIIQGTTVTNDLVQVYTNPDTGNCWGGLPFGVPGPFDIQFLNQNGYLRATAAAQMPNVGIAANCTPVTYVYSLVSGDVGGDGTINLKDLSTVLKNFAKTDN